MHSINIILNVHTYNFFVIGLCKLKVQVAVVFTSVILMNLPKFVVDLVRNSLKNHIEIDKKKRTCYCGR